MSSTIFLAPHPFSSLRQKKFDTSVDEENKILFDLREKSPWFPSSETITSGTKIYNQQAREYGDNFGLMKLDKTRHVRSISEPRQKFQRPVATSHQIGWHRGALPERDSHHKTSSSDITQYFMNMLLTKSNAIIR